VTPAIAAAETAADWSALGCAVRLVVGEPRDLAVATTILDAELSAIDRVCSRFRTDSELSRVCADSAGRPVPISALLAEAVDAALWAAAASDGDVDPTVGRAMEQLGYDRDYAAIPTDAGPVTVVRRSTHGWRRIGLDRSALTLRVPRGVLLDLGATAKAFCADRAAGRIADALDGRGVLVALGGDVAAAGTPPPGGWSVRVQDVTGPVGAEPTGPTQVVSLPSGGLATSSTTARRWVRGGRVLHHILDPRTGVPVPSPWRTVTVAAPTCLAANVASTAAIVRGWSAVDWLVGLGLAARIVDRDGHVTLLPGWPVESDRP